MTRSNRSRTLQRRAHEGKPIPQTEAEQKAEAQKSRMMLFGLSIVLAACAAGMLFMTDWWEIISTFAVMAVLILMLRVAQPALREMERNRGFSQDRR